MNLDWYIKRAQQMSASEIGIKLYQRVTAPWLVRSLQQHSQPAILRKNVLLPFESMQIDELQNADLIRIANRIKGGDRWVLGLGWLPYGSWNWRADPVTRKLWPLIPSHRLNYRRLGTEIRLTWELNRFHDLTVMAQAFWLTRDITYVEKIHQVFDEWCMGNPVGVGPNWVSAMEAAIRIVNMTWVARMIHKVSPNTATRIGHQMAIHKAFIEHHLSSGSSANNHLLVELMGLIVSYAFWQFSEGRDYTRHYGNKFVAELQRQTGINGMNREMSSHYHLLVAETAIHVTTALQARSLKFEKLDILIANMRQVIEALATFEEGICRFGDDDNGQIVRFPSGRWERALAGMENNVWTPLPPMVELKASPQVQNFDGIVVCRCGPYRVIVDCGETGLEPLYAHAHDDGGSVYIGYNGRWFIIDPGTGGYFRDISKRRLFMEADSHNSPTTDNLKGRLMGPFTWEKSPKRFYVKMASVDIDESAIMIMVESENGNFRRTVLTKEDCVEITDESQEKPFSVRVTVPSSWKCCYATQTKSVFEQSAERLSISWNHPTSLRESVWSPRFGLYEMGANQISCEHVMRVHWEVTRC